jgi:hypothetical protein
MLTVNEINKKLKERKITYRFAGLRTTAHPTLIVSDGHGYGDPRRVTGTGHCGTGTGVKTLPRDVPVPVWAGDGSVTGSVRSDVSTFSTLSKLTTTLPHLMDSTESAR